MGVVLTTFETWYVAGWSLFCVLGLVIGIRGVRIPWRDARAFLLVPWKIALFAPAIVFVTLAGRFTDDETWDLVTGGGMSIFTALTAWWAVGTMARVVRKLAPPSHLIVALAVMFFSSAWFYDGYLLLRDHAYTPRWLGNLMLSPTTYLCAGIVQNLELREGKLALAWTRADWPRPLTDRTKHWPLALAALPFVAVAADFLVGAVGWHLP